MAAKELKWDVATARVLLMPIEMLQLERNALPSMLGGLDVVR